MADILIKNMEMPTNCLWCEIRDCSYGNDLYLERPNDCPLVEVKPHGRLIDADKLLQEGKELSKEVGMLSSVVAVGHVKNAPTVLEANNGSD